MCVLGGLVGRVSPLLGVEASRGSVAPVQYNPNASHSASEDNGAESLHFVSECALLPPSAFDSLHTLATNTYSLIVDEIKAELRGVSAHNF